MPDKEIIENWQVSKDHKCLGCGKDDGKTIIKQAYNWTGAGGSGALMTEEMVNGVKRKLKLGHWLHEECHKEWYRGLIVGLANLDQVMNYCKYFERSNGNKGLYIRDGKSCEVNGQWDQYYVENSAIFPPLGLDYSVMKRFRSFLKENGWLDCWFEVREQYQKYILS